VLLLIKLNYVYYITYCYINFDINNKIQSCNKYFNTILLAASTQE
jgi:hypothetical protein